MLPTPLICAKDLTPHLAEFLALLQANFFDILKCGKSDCILCMLPQLPVTEFGKLGHLPDPVPGTDDHYKPFGEVFCTTTTEEHRPSAKHKARKEKSLPFYPIVQHVKNTEMMLICDECSMWRL